MSELQVFLLGNGGCVSAGLPYNAFLLGHDFLVEAPPDVMVSLQKQGRDFTRIRRVFVSHFHGDHVFGLPFLLINQWIHSLENGPGPGPVIYGPKGVQDHTLALYKLAFAKEHPGFEWVKNAVDFVEVGPDSPIVFHGLGMEFFPLRHVHPCLGFLLKGRDGGVPFAYIADTVWCGSVERVLSQKPATVLMDMNGGNAGIHISLDQVMEKGLAITGESTTYYGTHLYEPFEPPHSRIQCARPGDALVIGSSAG